MSSKELAIIERLAQVLGSGDFGDDAFYDAHRRLILTTDMLVEGTHFRRDTFSPADIGWKAAAVNLSDIAAMGGELCYLLVSLGLPNALDIAFVEALYQGISACVGGFNGRIVGGDTIASPQLTLNITAIGQLPHGHTLGQRNQARPGDWIITTGPHGLSAAGLQILQGPIKVDENIAAPLIQAHRRPQPKILEGLALSGLCPRYALMDTSDGLADALLKIATASQQAIQEQDDTPHASPMSLQLVLDEARLPIPKPLGACAAILGHDPLDWMLYGGEDFELLATVPAETVIPPAFTVIGEVRPGSPGSPATALLRRQDESLLPLEMQRTYQHFSNGK